MRRELLVVTFISFFDLYGNEIPLPIKSLTQLGFQASISEPLDPEYRDCEYMAEDDSDADELIRLHNARMAQQVTDPLWYKKSSELDDEEIEEARIDTHKNLKELKAQGEEEPKPPKSKFQQEWEEEQKRRQEMAKKPIDNGWKIEAKHDFVVDPYMTADESFFQEEKPSSEVKK